MNILHIKLYVRTDIKGCIEETLFHNNQKDGKLFRITSSYKRRHLSLCTIASMLPLRTRLLTATSQPGRLEQWCHTQLQEYYFSFVFSKWQILGRRWEGPSSGKKKAVQNFSQWHEVEQDNITMSTHVLEKPYCGRLRRN